MINYPVICNILIYLYYMCYCTCEHLKCNKSHYQKQMCSLKTNVSHALIGHSKGIFKLYSNQKSRKKGLREVRLHPNKQNLCRVYIHFKREKSGR